MPRERKRPKVSNFSRRIWSNYKRQRWTSIRPLIMWVWRYPHLHNIFTPFLSVHSIPLITHSNKAEGKEDDLTNTNAYSPLTEKNTYTKRVSVSPLVRVFVHVCVCLYVHNICELSQSLSSSIGRICMCSVCVCVKMYFSHEFLTFPLYSMKIKNKTSTKNRQW